MDPHVAKHKKGLCADQFIASSIGSPRGEGTFGGPIDEQRVTNPGRQSRSLAAGPVFAPGDLNLRVSRSRDSDSNPQKSRGKIQSVGA
jgi:hypothetical protein